MSILGFSPEFRDQVEDGRKCRTYRMPKCIYERKTGRCTHIGIGSICSHDYLNCPGYEYRIKTGDTIHAYTGLMQRKYCKADMTDDYCEFYGQDLTCLRITDKTITIKYCPHQGALLLRQDLPKCTETFPIKMGDITEEDARLDGFESLAQLIDFLIKNYDAKPDTPIQAIIWEELKGRNHGKA